MNLKHKRLWMCEPYAIVKITCYPLSNNVSSLFRLNKCLIVVDIGNFDQLFAFHYRVNESTATTLVARLTLQMPNISRKRNAWVRLYEYLDDEMPIAVATFNSLEETG